MLVFLKCIFFVFVYGYFEKCPWVGRVWRYITNVALLFSIWYMLSFVALMFFSCVCVFVGWVVTDCSVVTVDIIYVGAVWGSHLVLAQSKVPSIRPHRFEWIAVENAPIAWLRKMTDQWTLLIRIWANNELLIGVSLALIMFRSSHFIIQSFNDTNILIN